MDLIITGDSLFSSTNLINRLDAKIIKLLKNSDVAFTNAEFSTPQKSTAPAANRGYVTAVRANRLDELVNLKFNLINFANNHTGDFGVQGIIDTINAAEKRKIEPVGIGSSLDAARKPHFQDTPDGRIAIVSAATTRSKLFLASNAGNGVPARPGLNPLRWDQSYVLDDPEYQQLLKINHDLGTEHSAKVGSKIERWPQLDSDHFYFGSMYEDKLLIERGNTTRVKTKPDRSDLEAVKKSVLDAKRRSNFVIFSVHTHEGQAENWYASEPADFVKNVAHEVIDAGADIFVGHGAHFLRGIEWYHDKPILYNLGSFLMEFEAGESIIPPEMYQSYGLESGAVPSDLHEFRSQNKNGQFVGFNADPVFSEGVILRLNFAELETKYQLIPIDLQLTNKDSLKRGLPVSASLEKQRIIINRLKKLSEKFGTYFQYDEVNHSVSFER